MRKSDFVIACAAGCRRLTPFALHLLYDATCRLDAHGAVAGTASRRWTALSATRSSDLPTLSSRAQLDRSGLLDLVRLCHARMTGV